MSTKWDAAITYLTKSRAHLASSLKGETADKIIALQKIDHRLGIAMLHRTKRAQNGGGVLHIPFTLKEVRDRDKWICQICKQTIQGELNYDHWIPLSAGGPHTLSNVRMTHKKCNEDKGSKLPPIGDLPPDLVADWNESQKLLRPYKPGFEIDEGGGTKSRQELMRFLRRE